MEKNNKTASENSFTENELTQLLEINKAINVTRNSIELLAAIKEKVLQLIPFHDTGILIVEKDGLHHYDMAVNYESWDDTEGNRQLRENGLLRLVHPASYVEHVMQLIEKENSPVIENYVLRYKEFDYPFFPIIKKAGYKEGIVAVLKSGGKIFGTFWLNSLKKNHFKKQQFRLFQSIAEQISVAVSNILATEEILEREKEKSQLLEISEAIATVQNTTQLLKIIYEKIKPLLPYDNAGLFILNKEADSVYEITDSDVLPDSIQVELQSGNLLGPFPLTDVTKDFWFFYPEPAISNLKLQASYVISEEGKRHFEIALAHGLQEMICGPLKCRGKKIGMLCFNTKQVGFYTAKHIPFFKSLSDVIAIAVANILANEEILQREQEKTTLLNISNAISKINDKVALLRSIDDLLWPLFHHDDAGFSIVDKEKKTFVEYYNLYSKEIPRSEEAQYLNGIVYQEVYNTGGYTLPYPGSLIEYYMHLPPEMGLLKDVLPLNLNPELIQLEMEHGLQYFICSPLKVGGNTIGLFNLLFKEVNKPNTAMLGLFSQIAEIMAMAISNILAHEEILQREKEKSLLLNISQKLSNTKKMDELLQIILMEVKPIFNFYDTGILLIDNLTNSSYDLSVINPHIDDSEVNHMLHKKKYYKENYLPLKNSALEKLIQQLANESPIIFDYRLDYSSFSDGELLDELKKGGYIQGWACPLLQQGKIIGVLMLNYNQEHQIPFGKQSLFLALADRIASSITNILATEEILLREKEIATLNKQLQAQNEYLIEEVEEVYNFDEMVGQNKNFQDACKNIGLVAKTDSTVLILGETGTGKELVARAIHNNSARKNKPLIKLNCAALPANLIESELFGHERGAFTGAVERRIGKFELANNSTLFLDEVGELPLELQAKLLRALQEKEIERLGSNKTLTIDVRIIAATNRDLTKEVRDGKFRQDLYYRLHIFPITLPPLRDRKEDIPLLASHFIQKYSKKMGKKIHGLNHKAVQDIMSYSWPGNIRELEHVIERSVILAKSKMIQDLDLPLISKNKITFSPNEFVIKPWEEQERDYILEVLKATNGNVTGKGGAAELLQLPATTLQSKMNKLGIKRGHFAAKKVEG